VQLKGAKQNSEIRKYYRLKDEVRVLVELSTTVFFVLLQVN
jgi:predicted transcriptional regulator